MAQIVQRHLPGCVSLKNLFDEQRPFTVNNDALGAVIVKILPGARLARILSGALQSWPRVWRCAVPVDFGVGMGWIIGMSLKERKRNYDRVASSPEPTPVGAGSSAARSTVSGPAWLSFPG